MTLEGKNIVLCITGGIAAYKAVSLASLLKKKGANIYAILTKNARRFITPLTLKTITGNKVTTTMFDESDFIPHISLSELADIVLVAPATANIIAKAANGLADDMISTMLLSSKAHKIIIPAMNTNMYLNPITQANMATLKEHGFKIMEPESGMMACGTSGPGRFPVIETIYDYIKTSLYGAKDDYQNKRVLITVGGTIEDIDPVRFITNRSSGRMGFAFAAEFIKRRAQVTLIVGNVSDQTFNDFSREYPAAQIIRVRSADDMKDEVLKRADDYNIYVMAAAVADYKPVYADHKIKKSDDDLSITLTRNTDILQALPKREDAVYIGFAAETQDLLENARKKLQKKALDFLIANKVKGDKSAIGSHKAEVYLINKYNEELTRIEYADKDIIAALVIDAITHYHKSE